MPGNAAFPPAMLRELRPRAALCVFPEREELERDFDAEEPAPQHPVRRLRRRARPEPAPALARTRVACPQRPAVPEGQLLVSPQPPRTDSEVRSRRRNRCPSPAATRCLGTRPPGRGRSHL